MEDAKLWIPIPKSSYESSAQLIWEPQTSKFPLHVRCFSTISYLGASRIKILTLPVRQSILESESFLKTAYSAVKIIYLPAFPFDDDCDGDNVDHNLWTDLT